MHWLTKQFELLRSGSTPNIMSMEGLRGLAAILVFLTHYVILLSSLLSEKASINTFANSLGAIGNSGVDLFFVLSGYLIYGSLILRNQLFFLFMSRRIQRIYPTFIVVFSTYIVLSFVVPSKNEIPSNTIKD